MRACGSTTWCARSGGGAARGTGFTLTELLVVIAIITLLLVLAVPAFRSIVYSSEQALAQTRVQAALGAARDAAIRSGGADTAAVFVYSRGQAQVVACVWAGRIEDRVTRGPMSNAVVFRDVFVPDPSVESVSLPRGFTVRGYAAAYTLNGEWYDRTHTADWDKGGWVFPETDFFGVEQNDDGADRQTFLVRFEAGTGSVVVSSSDEALVVLPRASSEERTGVWKNARFDRESRLDVLVRRVLTDTKTFTDADRRTLLGDKSGDTVLARPVSQLALCDEKRLVGACGGRTDAVTGCAYRDPGQSGEPEFVAGVTPEKVNQYIRGDTNFDDEVNSMEGDEPTARVFTVDRARGVLTEAALEPPPDTGG